MCFFKKKKKPVVPENTKFKLGDYVLFKRRDELMFGWVYEIKVDEDGNVIYDVQVGGQCPAIIKGLKEEELRLKPGK